MIKLHNIFFLFILLFFCCKKLYNPPSIIAPENYLVVEGVINSGNDSTIIILSKTVNINAKKTVNPVLGASVTVESDQNNIWPLRDDGNGRYISAALHLSLLQRYRLRINTIDGQQYLSDFLAVKSTPPIDSVGYLIKNGSIQLYVNTHDPSKNSRYYRWDYDETWMFHSKYGSSYIVDTMHQTVVVRRPDQYVFSCFGNDVSTNILLASTSQLSSDIVYQNSLINIPLTSEKFEQKYSICVRQYALTKDAYQFYLILKKNTEELGNLFGPLPSKLSGNIHCITDTNRLAIGYLTVTNIQSKRIFISNSALPVNISTIYPYDCALDTALGPDFFVTPPYNYVPIAIVTKGYIYSSKECVDCTVRGTTKTPSFWR